MDFNLNFLEKTHFETNGGSFNPLYLNIDVIKSYEESNSSDITKPSLTDAFLFHEFIHQIQLTSSIIGMNLLESQISIWHNTRNYISEKNENTKKELLEEIKSCLKIQKSYKDIQKYSIKSIDEIINHREIFNEIETKGQGPIKIKCKTGDETKEILFGMPAFFESSAYLFEKLFIEKLNIKSDNFNTPLIPYKLGEIIANSICGIQIPEKILAMAYCVSMQGIAPHKTFIQILNIIDFFYKKKYDSITCRNNLRIKNNLTKISNTLIDANSKYLKSVVNDVKEGFPIDDPLFGNLIIKLFEKVEININSRKTEPFTELNFIEKINNDNFKNYLKDLIIKFGGCSYNLIDPLTKKLIKKEQNIIGGSDSIFFNSLGFKIYRTSISHAISHIHPKKEKIEYEIKAPIEKACPIYAYCDHKNKNEAICKKSPFNHQSTKIDEKSCPYEISVFKFRIENSKNIASLLTT